MATVIEDRDGRIYVQTMVSAEPEAVRQVIVDADVTEQVEAKAREVRAADDGAAERLRLDRLVTRVNRARTLGEIRDLLTAHIGDDVLTRTVAGQVRFIKTGE